MGVYYGREQCCAQVLGPVWLNNADVAPVAGPVLRKWAGQGQGVGTNSLWFVVGGGVHSGMAVARGSGHPPSQYLGLIWRTAATRDIP